MSDKTTEIIVVGISPEQVAEIKEKMKSEFPKAYGHYENVSATMFITFYAGANPGEIIWQKGLADGEALMEDLILPFEEAIVRYIKALEAGYEQVIKATTREAIEKALQERFNARSDIYREGLLGTYYKGKWFFRLSEFTKGLFSAERGYDEMIDGNKHKLTAEQAREELAKALSEGFRKDGQDISDSNKSLDDIFGL